jgi:hypothetical protein
MPTRARLTPAIADVRRAVREGELRLSVQPKLAVSSGRIVGGSDDTGKNQAMRSLMTVPPNWLSCLKRPAW